MHACARILFDVATKLNWFHDNFRHEQQRWQWLVRPIKLYPLLFPKHVLCAGSTVLGVLSYSFTFPHLVWIA